MNIPHVKPRVSAWDAVIMFCSLPACLIMLCSVGSQTQWALSLITACFLWLAGIQIHRREANIRSVVDRYIKLYEASSRAGQRRSALQMLLDAGALTTRNNRALNEVRRRIRKHHIPDPADLSPMLKRGNLHRFLRFSLKNNLRLDEAGDIMGAIGRYKGLFKS
jgi:hypothetical protein